MQPLDILVVASLERGAVATLLLGVAFSIALVGKSILDFTRTGPEMADEVLTHYRVYLAYSLARLFVFAFSILAFVAYLGIVAYVAGLVVFDARYDGRAAVAFAFAAAALLIGRRFAHTLLYSPGVIAASSLYSMTHFYGLWRALTPGRLRAIDTALFFACMMWLGACLAVLAQSGAWSGLALLAGIVAAYGAIVYWGTRQTEPPPLPPRARAAGRP